MYKLLLILKYLRRKLAPIFAALAVTLCTAMVIIVISVMGGFLQMMRAAAKTLTGEVTVRSDLVGFSNYEQLEARLRELPQVQASAAMVRAYGLLNLEGNIEPIEVLGIDPERYDAVTDYFSTLHWTPERMVAGVDQVFEQMGDMPSAVQLDALRAKDRFTRLIAAGRTLIPPEDWAADPGMVPGIEVYSGNMRDGEGQYDFMYSGVSREATLTVLPLSARGAIGAYEPQVQKFTIVNEFKSGLYEVDKNRTYVPFALLQKMLKMEPIDEDELDPQTGEPTGERFFRGGRAHEVMLRGKPGVPLAELAAAVKQAVAQFQRDHPDARFLQVETWEQRHSILLNAVEKEKGLLTFLFAFISLVAIFMIAVIFYMIVLEKTRDIGTLRAIGASRQGIANIFLGYGLAIGILGAALGLALAAAIVWNLNEIQDQLFAWFGFKMWDPRVYYFERIPNQLDSREVAVILAFAVLSSVAGSIVPAFLAARLNPVESLRYE